MAHMTGHTDEKILALKGLIRDSRRIVFFTGAGISTESGISDYRSQGGLWQRYQPVTIQEFTYDEEKRKEYWRRKKDMYGTIRNAEPSDGHKAAAELEKAGKCLGVITQNIDGLHRKAGSERVFELHGTNLEVICLHCGAVKHFDHAYDRLLAGEEAPLCLPCGGLLKPNTISFGQALDPAVLSASVDLAQKADLMICAGSTLIVEPAASMPRYACNAGAKLVIINHEPTPLDALAALVIHASIGQVLSAALKD